MTYFLTPGDPIVNSSKISCRKNILTMFGEDWMKIVAFNVDTNQILQILRFDLVTYFLIPPDPFKN